MALKQVSADSLLLWFCEETKLMHLHLLFIHLPITLSLLPILFNLLAGFNQTWQEEKPFQI